MVEKISTRSLSNRGFVLMASYFFISVLSVMSLAFLTRGFFFLGASERNQNRTVAFNMADGAVDLAITQLQSNSNYAGSGGYAALGNGGGYEVVVCPPTCDGLIQPTNANVRLIQATGHAPSNNAGERAYESRILTAYVQFEENRPFDYAVFADGNIDLGGNAITDSYDSRDGAYGEPNVSDNGDITTNSTSDNAVTLSGNAVVNGDAITGPNSDPNDVIQIIDNAEITGALEAASELRSYNSADDVSVSSSGSEGALHVGGDDIVYLNSGTYNYTSVTVTDNGQLIPSGDVTFNVSGAFTLNGNGGLVTPYGSMEVNVSGAFAIYGNGVLAPKGSTTINAASTVSISDNGVLAPQGPTQITASGNVNIEGNGVATYNDDPSSFILSVTNTSTVLIDGNADFYGGVYAPESDVTIYGNGNIHGAVVADDFVCTGNCLLHYDEALEEVSVSTVDAIEVLSWIESNTVAAN